MAGVTQCMRAGQPTFLMSFIRRNCIQDNSMRRICQFCCLQKWSQVHGHLLFTKSTRNRKLAWMVRNALRKPFTTHTMNVRYVWIRLLFTMKYEQIQPSGQNTTAIYHTYHECTLRMNTSFVYYEVWTNTAMWTERKTIVNCRVHTKIFSEKEFRRRRFLEEEIMGWWEDFVNFVF